MQQQPSANNYNNSITHWQDPGAANLTTGAECTICYENPIDSVLYMCGHMCMCYECAIQQWRGIGGGHCPLCRAVIRDVIRTYKSWFWSTTSTTPRMTYNVLNEKERTRHTANEIKIDLLVTWWFDIVTEYCAAVKSQTFLDIPRHDHLPLLSFRKFVIILMTVPP